MIKIKSKHRNKVATGATRCNFLTRCAKMLHPRFFDKVATRVQQGATLHTFFGTFSLIPFIFSLLQRCCMLHPCFQFIFSRNNEFLTPVSSCRPHE